MTLISTGQVAGFLDDTEPRLNDLIRRRKIDPAPPIIAGRRLWSRAHVLQAARALRVSLTEAQLDRLLSNPGRRP